MTLYVYHSNQQEVLVDTLASIVRTPLRSPLAKERIVVQNNGMARWLSIQLAERLNLCAHTAFIFPAEWLWQLIRAVLPTVPETSTFDRPTLRWRVMGLLRSLPHDHAFAPVHAYLQSDKEDYNFRCYDLACQIADCFDRYLMYRPDWITAWERGEEKHWQAILWRLLAQQGHVHRMHVHDTFLTALKTADARLLPERVSIMGSGTLPPAVFKLFVAAADIIDVHLFVLNPCCEYWGDVETEHRQAALSGEQDPNDLYLTVGHPLLAALGKQGRDFIDQLLDHPMVEQELFIAPEGQSILHQMQHDILHLIDRTGERLPLPTDDPSIRIHICHSALREVEVLHDQLLAILGEKPQRFQTTDILVMTPDIETYAPLIEAVFGTAPPERKIPFTIADRSIVAENPLIETFFTLLEGQGRFPAPAVLNLLESTAVARRFSISDAEARTLQTWIQDAGIRWGIDGAFKKQWGLPETREHTWRLGLDRLLLGYALPGKDDILYEGIAPHDAVEGTEALTLGHLQRFCSTLFDWEAILRTPRTWPEWVDCLHCLLEAFFQPEGDEEQAIYAIRSAISTLSKQIATADLQAPIALEVVASALRQEMNANEGNAGRFWGGGITFCSMVPMRSIPFPIIALLGMNDDAYPRKQFSGGFDLMANSFRRGDRSRGHDDRYLFLEMLLSARKRLSISYVGRDIHDDTVIPPSVLVNTLIDAIDRSFEAPEKYQKASETIIVRHPLQPFSPRYFEGNPKLFSYAQEWVEASRTVRRGFTGIRPLLTGALPEPEAAFRTITVEGLVQFFSHPTQWLLRERLGIRPRRTEAFVQASEPFMPDALESYTLDHTIFSLYKNDSYLKKEAMEAVVRDKGVLPHGAVGTHIFEDAHVRVGKFAKRVSRYQSLRSPRRPMTIHVVIPAEAGIQKSEMPDFAGMTKSDFIIQGYWQGLTRHGWVGYRMAKVKAKDYLWLWINHLILNTIRPEKAPLESHWVATDQDIHLAPVDNAEAILQHLLSLYWKGTQELLHFFPKSALTYHQNMEKGKPEEVALAAAKGTWKGSEYQKTGGESEDIYYQLAFRGCDPLDDQFKTHARQVFQPIFQCMDEKKEDE